MNFVINIAQPNEYEKYVEYLPDIRKEFKKFSFSELKPEQILYVIKPSEQEEKPTAFFVLKNNHIVQNFYVFPEHRNKGIGTLCVAYIMKKYGSARIFVRGKNKRAIEFYKENNFNPTKYFKRHNIYQYDFDMTKKYRFKQFSIN